MTSLLAQSLSNELQSIGMMLLILNALLHIIFAGAVAKDAGNLYKKGRQTELVSALVWAFATLVGGVFVAAVYWFMHHVQLNRR